MGEVPALLLLDELSMGLAPTVVGRLYELVADVAATSISVLVVERSARVVLRVADYAAIMVNGRVTRVGQPADLEDELSVTPRDTRNIRRVTGRRGDG